MAAKQADFYKQDFIESGLRLRKYELEMQWEAIYGNGRSNPHAAVPATVAEPTEAQLVTKVQAAKLLAVSIPTLDRLRQDGELHAVKRLLPKVRFRLEDIERLIQARRRQ